MGGVSWFDRKSGDNFTDINEAKVEEDTFSVMENVQNKKEVS